MSIIENSFLSPAASNRVDRTQNDKALSRSGGENQDNDSFSRYLDRELQNKPASTKAQQAHEVETVEVENSENEQAEVVLFLLEAETGDLPGGNIMPKSDQAPAEREPLMALGLSADENFTTLASPVIIATEPETGRPELDAVAQGIPEPELDDVELQIKTEKGGTDQVLKIETDQNDLIKAVKLVSTQQTLSPQAVTENAHRTTDSVPQLSIQTPVNNARWGADLSQRINMLIQTDNQQIAKIQLNPDQLGPVGVRIQIEDDQARISFVTSHHSVKEAIEASLPRLRDMLQEQGLNLADVDVSARNSEGSDDFSNEQRFKNGTDDELNTEQSDVLIPVQMEVPQGLSVFV